jgi:hypothetical protein
MRAGREFMLRGILIQEKVLILALGFYITMFSLLMDGKAAACLWLKKMILQFKKSITTQ